jgi:hypothetical protein
VLGRHCQAGIHPVCTPMRIPDLVLTANVPPWIANSCEHISRRRNGTLPNVVVLCASAIAMHLLHAPARLIAPPVYAACRREAET